MKKIWITLMILCVFLTGCAKVESKLDKSPNEPIDITGKRTVFYHGEKQVPLSLTIDGEQQIQNGIYWYYELDDLLEEQWNDSFYTYDEKSLDLSGSLEFENLKKGNYYATNGGWALFLSPVHTEYTPANQKKVDPTIAKLAKAQLKANQIEADAVITDVWHCDLDQDGTEEQLFLTKNETEKYCFLGYANGDNCQVLDGAFDRSDLPEIEPMICDFEGDGKWSVLLHKSGDYECFSIFDFNEGTFFKCYDVIF